MAINLPRRPMKSLNVSVATNAVDTSVMNRANQSIAKGISDVGNVLANYENKIQEKQKRADIEDFSTSQSFATLNNVSDRLSTIENDAGEDGMMPEQIQRPDGTVASYMKQDEKGQLVPMSYEDAVNDAWASERAGVMASNATEDQKAAYDRRIEGSHRKSALDAKNKMFRMKAAYGVKVEGEGTKDLTRIAMDGSLGNVELGHLLRKMNQSSLKRHLSGSINTDTYQRLVDERNTAVNKAFFDGQVRKAKDLAANGKPVAANRILSMEMSRLLSAGSNKETIQAIEEGRNIGIDEAIAEVAHDDPNMAYELSSQVNGAKSEPVKHTPTKYSDIMAKAVKPGHLNTMLNQLASAQSRMKVTSMKKSIDDSRLIASRLEHGLVTGVAPVLTAVKKLQYIPEGQMRRVEASRVVGSKVAFDMISTTASTTAEERTGISTDFKARLKVEQEEVAKALGVPRSELFSDDFTMSPAYSRLEKGVNGAEKKLEEVLKSNPAGVALTYDAKVREASSKVHELKSAGASPMEIQTAVKDQLMAQEDYYRKQGVPEDKWTYLDLQTKENYIDSLRTPMGASFDGTQVENVVADIKANYGTRAPVIIKELAASRSMPKESKNAINAVLYTPENGDTVALAFSKDVIDGINNRKKTDYDFKGAIADTNAGVASALEPYISTITNGDNTMAGLSRAKHVSDATMKVANMLVMNGAEPVDAAKAAVEQVLEANYSKVIINEPGASAKVFIPKHAESITGSSIDDIAYATENFISREENNISKLDVDYSKFNTDLLDSAGLDITDERQKTLAFRQVLQRGSWKTRHDEGGIAFMVPVRGRWYPVKNNKGGYITRTWRQVTSQPTALSVDSAYKSMTVAPSGGSL